jgi:predicted transcriptional regulator
MSKNTQITADELRAELEALGACVADDEARTVREWADEWGCGVDKVRRLLRKAQEAGRVVRVPKTIQTLSGTTRRVVAFKVS